MMRWISKRRLLGDVGLEGALLALAPFPCATLAWGTAGAEPALWRLILVALSVLGFIASAFFIARLPRWGRSFFVVTLLLLLVSLIPFLRSSPFITLTVLSAAILSLYAVIDYQIVARVGTASSHGSRCLQRARWASGIAALSSLSIFMLNPGRPIYVIGSLLVTGLCCLFMLGQWAWVDRRDQALWRIIGSFVICGLLLLPLCGLAMSATTLLAQWYPPLLTLLPFMGAMPQQSGAGFPFAVIMAALFASAWLVIPHQRKESASGPWWAPLIDHPARMLVTTFMGLCVLGTCFLLLPWSTSDASISVVDALFTAVSAVCVTGLTVVDTVSGFTIYGQIGILLLIQLGGLGIMTISTVALHIFGQRLNMRRERLLHVLADGYEGNLVDMLFTVVRFTLIAEGIGVLLLAPQFWLLGDGIGMALWRGLFTSVSAYCNAGFALQSDSLIGYAHAPFVLHTVALLIIVGGMAPAVVMAVPRWLRRKSVPVVVHLVLGMTILLLVSGFLFILMMEWNDALGKLSILDKLHNAWFQSVTLRTAGFNSVDMTSLTIPSLMLMILLMFIGGSPGGTAGGVKTTTLGVLGLTMWASVSARDEVHLRDRRLPSSLIYRAIGVIGTGLCVWFLAVLALVITQPEVPFMDLLFETTSAIGTVGLTIGGTAQLDGIGKVIVVIIMFLGRIGPLTLFMLLSEDSKIERQKRIDARIPLS